MANISDTGNLETRLAARANHFNALRLFLAAAVCIDHAWVITTGDPASEPIRLFGLTAGWLAVNGFFVLSGLLIARSLDRKGFSLSYVAARALRLYPALIALTALATFVIGPLMARGTYWSDPGLFTLMIEALHFGDTAGGPVGFAANNPIPQEFSSPLWTLRYEVLCYVLAPFALLFGTIRKPLVMLALVAGLGVAVAIIEPFDPRIDLPPSLVSALRLGFAFGVGMAIWSARKWITPNWKLAAGGAGLFLISGLSGYAIDATATLALAGLILWLGLLPAQPSRLRDETDISYGLYIWHFPVMQILEARMDDPSPLLMLALGVSITAVVSYTSWRLVERPALRFKRSLWESPKLSSTQDQGTV